MLGIGVEEMFEHLPSLLGRQLEHCFLAFTQAQPLHELVRLHLQHSTIFRIGVMLLSYNERAVSEGRFRHHLFQAVFVRTSYPSRYVYFRWSRVHKAVETAVTATVVM